MTGDPHIKAGILGGTLFSAFFNITLNDIVFTVVMAGIGAFVSFIVSYSLKRLFKKNHTYISNH
jgi:hypothetical protein